MKARGGRRTFGPAGPRFAPVVREVAKLIRPAKLAGRIERAEALIEVMRIIDALAKREVAP